MRLLAETKADLLRQVPLFAHCSGRELRTIARIATQRPVEEGSTLITEGEPGDAFFALVEGTVDVRRRGRRVAQLGPGSFVGEIALLSRQPRTATVTAATPLVVLEIAGSDFVELLDAKPELWLKVARTLADRVEADEAAGR